MNISAPDLSVNPLPPVVLFTGKGGVGKTTLSCATAIALADSGKRVLLVSTDPASNLDEMLGTRLGYEPTPVLDVPNLHACNLDPEEAAERHRRSVIDPVRGALPETLIRQMEEQLSGACTVEVAGFNAFTKFVADAEVRARFDHIILDTAPTGHTLRLLSLPSAWTDFLDTNRSGNSCLGPVKQLVGERSRYAETVDTLKDGKQTVIFLVARPDHASLREAERSRFELRELGFDHLGLLINHVFTLEDCEDPVALAWQARSKEALEGMADGLAKLPQKRFPFRPLGTVGLSALRDIFNEGSDRAESDPLAAGSIDALIEQEDSLGVPWEQWVDEVEANPRGVILFMGKGGVGKTTLATRFAVELARRGVSVHLSTTDPAGHLNLDPGGERGESFLTVGRIDPREEVARYTEQVMRRAESTLDAQALLFLEEELKSPCTEEIAVFQAFARQVAEGEDRVVVLDTAPTGHTVLLLDASLAYAKELERQTGADLPKAAVELLPRLRDPAFTRIFLVTLAEATPVHEAASLSLDLERAGLSPKAWLVNQTLTGSGTKDARLALKAGQERSFFQEVAKLSHNAWTILPWQSDWNENPQTGEPLLIS